jgi:hypothetical protein
MQRDKDQRSLATELSVVAFETDGRWIAQCVQYDIAAFADNLADLPGALFLAIKSNMSVNAHLGRSGLDGLPAAPTKFRDMFEHSRLEVSLINNGVGPANDVFVHEMRVA